MKNLVYFAVIISLCVFLTLSGCVSFPSLETTPAAPDVNVTPSVTLTPINPTWTPPPPTSVGTSLPSIADVVEKVRPSVVAINTVSAGTDIFGQTIEGAGSGWIIDSNGIIVTNYHVVEGSRTITVTLADGRTFDADISKLAADPLNDLAIIYINETGLPSASVNINGSARVGDWVVAIGNSLGQGISATNGIISAKNISLEISAGQTLENLLQTDAAINPGNSGGPLVNLAGEVIGITSVKVAEVGVEGMGYAINTTNAMPIIQQLISKGYVIRPWLGVTIDNITQFDLIRYRLAVTRGGLIREVAAGSPADKAGLRALDVITYFNGKEINTAQELLTAIHTSSIGAAIEINYWRGSGQTTTTAQLVESPPPS